MLQEYEILKNQSVQIINIKSNKKLKLKKEKVL